MAEYTVKFLIETLQAGYDPNETVVATWWSKADVAQVIEDEGYGREGLSDEEFVDNTWHHVSGDVDVALDYYESDMNGDIHRFVEDYVMRGEK